MARPKAEVAAELSALGCNAADPLLETLATLLMPGETITDAVGVKSVPRRGTWNGAVELLLLTTARIVNVTITDHSYMYWKDVVSIDKTISDDYLDVTIFGVTGAGSLNFDHRRGWSGTWDTKMLTAVIREIDAKIHQMKMTRQEAQARSSANFIDELERLAALKHSGSLTDEEFQAAKRKLLGTGR